MHAEVGFCLLVCFLAVTAMRVVVFVWIWAVRRGGFAVCCRC